MVTFSTFLSTTYVVRGKMFSVVCIIVHRWGGGGGARGALFHDAEGER